MSIETPCLHLVPNGVHGTSKQGCPTLRLQLLLLPSQCQEFSGNEATLWSRTKWPSQAHAWFDRFIAEQPKVTLRGHDGKPVASGKICTALPPLTTEHRVGLDDLWYRALNGREEIEAFFKAATTSDTDRCGQRAVIPAPTLEASLLLPFERARATLERVGGPHGALASRAAARPAMHLLASIGRPWLGTAGRGVQLASAGADVLDPSIARLLLGPPDVADWLEKQGAGSSDETHPYDRLLDPETIAAAAIGHGEEDLLWLSDRLHALHHATLNLVAAEDKLPDPSGAAGRRLHQLLASPALMRLFGWVRDVLLEIEAPLPAGERAVYCSLVKEPSGATTQRIAGVLDTEGGGFFPAAPTDWQRLARSDGNEAPAPEPWAQRGMRVLAPARICIGSVEPILCTEADHQCQTQGRATRLITGPLSLYDLGKIKADSYTCEDKQLMFATDLAAPPRLYIGIDEQGGQTRWWPTSARTLALFDPWKAKHDEGWPNDALRALTPHWMPPWERDASGVTNATRYQGKDKDKKPTVPSHDPRLAAYHGDDLGAPPNELTPTGPGKHIRWEGGEVKLSRESDIFIDQRLAAAPDVEQAPLIFGLHLRVALAERSLGGGGPSFEHVVKALARPDSTAAWPPHDRPGYRYLRHEPIAKPMVFLAPDTEHGNALEHKLQTSERMVLVHAAAPHDNDARSMARTSRILLVPAVACAFAARHDVFDGAVEHTVIRVLETIESGKQVGGKDIPPKLRWATVPVTMPRQGLRDAVIENDGAMAPYHVGLKPAARFRVRRSGERTEIRKSPYYPDPAAALVVLRLAHPETGAWLEEPPLVLRLREPIESKGPTGWPDVLPVRIDLVAAEKSAPTRLGDGGWWEASGAAAAHHPGTAAPRIAMRVVTVTLAPGEAIKLHAWFVPEAADLAAWFDAAEQAAALAHAEGKIRGAEGAKAASEGLVMLLGECACADDRAVDATAEAFHAHMLTTPLPEIADTLELDCIYATDVPAITPAFVAGTVGLARPLKLEAAELTRFLGESGRASEWQKSVAAADDATALVPGGVVEFDPATTNQLVVEVEMAAPGSQTLDVELKPLPAQLAPLAPTPLPFAVDQHGIALFGHQNGPLPHSTHDTAAPISPRWVELMQIGNIPFPADARAGRRQLCLEEVVAGVSTDYPGVSVVFHPALEQTQARRARLRLRALPRHAPLITGKKTRKGKDTSPDKSAIVGPPSGILWAPATARPAPVVTEGFEPTFEWSALVRRQDGRGITIEGERRTVLRLRLQRPWFTSGEDERLAVVLWPPAAFALTDNETASFLPEDPFLQTLHEDDLGPLGRFVSVWGFDPLGAGPPAPLAEATLPKRRLSAFLNRTQIQLDGDARFHPHLLLPVPGQIALENLHGQQETMAPVAALSVPVQFRNEPSFPQSRGEAYVDLSLRLPYQSDVLFRLGLARLQENARPDSRRPAPKGARAGIQLSAPASIQGYVPPPRRFRVTVTPGDARSGAANSISLVAVSLAGPSPAKARDLDSRQVRMSLKERRGPDEVPVTDEDGHDAALFWTKEESRAGIEYRRLGDEERWTGVFRIPGNVLHEKRPIVVVIDEEDWLPDSSGGKPTIALPRFTVSIALLDK